MVGTQLQRFARDLLNLPQCRLRLNPLLRTLVLLVPASLFGLLGALALRFDFDTTYMPLWHRVVLPLTSLVACRTASYLYFGVGRDITNYFVMVDFIRLGKAHILSNMMWAAVVLMFRIPEFPRSLVVIECFLSFSWIAAFRIRKREVTQSREKAPAQKSHRSRAVVLGGGATADRFIRACLQTEQSSIDVVAALDDASHLWKSTLHGVSIQGPLSSLGAVLIGLPRIDLVVIAIPNLAETILLGLYNTCAQHGVEVRRIPSLEELAVTAGARPNKPLEEEALLGRTVSFQFPDFVGKQLGGKRILVTGAGGSIGSEIVKQLSMFAIQHITLLDTSEYNLFQLEGILKQCKEVPPYSLVIADIRDMTRLRTVFMESRPQLVFHAAALKHVPFTEANPSEAFLTNVQGSLNILELANEVQAERAVLISSDKAADPVGVLGMTKLIAERLFGGWHLSGDEGQTKTISVRFGNVINSSGSVIPLFREQILSGGPITVTHPEMSRYFMSRQEAVQLVLKAGLAGETRRIYVLDMGQPIGILDVARRMAELHDRSDIPIVFTGMRKGERMHEQILGHEEELKPTELAKIGFISRTPQPAHDLTVRIRFLSAEVQKLSAELALARIQELLVLTDPPSIVADDGCQS